MNADESSAGVDAAVKAAGAALDIVREQLGQAIAATKCHGCGCLHGTLKALQETSPGRAELRELFAQVRAVLQPERYACLGCDVCRGGE